MNVAFRVDASSRIGTGHVSRCLNLADELRRDGARVRFVARDLKGHQIERIRSAQFAVTVLPAPDFGIPDSGEYSAWLEVPAERDADETSRVLSEDAALDWLVVDHYALGLSWETSVRRVAKRLLVIDDLGDREHDCDVLVDQNALGPNRARYRGLVSDDCLCLLGMDYALLNREYLELRETPAPRADPVRRVVVFFGGVDRHDLTGRTLDAVARLERADVSFDVVVGESEKLPAFRRAGIAEGVDLYDRQSSLARLFTRADLALGAGGVTMWERCCVGLPSVVVAVADNQVPGAREAHRLGLIVYLGTHEEVDAAKLADALGAAIVDPTRVEQSRRGRLAVDGRGIARVAGLMRRGIDVEVGVRPAGAADEIRLLEWANEAAVRRSAFDGRPITPDVHRRWFETRLSDADHYRIFVGETPEGLCVGQVRFELDDSAWRIDYSVDSAMRGRGIGRRLLALGLESMASSYPSARFYGEVKRDNTASCRVFRRLGFAASERGEVLRFELTLTNEQRESRQ